MSTQEAEAYRHGTGSLATLEVEKMRGTRRARGLDKCKFSLSSLIIVFCLICARGIGLVKLALHRARRTARSE